MYNPRDPLQFAAAVRQIKDKHVIQQLAAQHKNDPNGAILVSIALNELSTREKMVTPPPAQPEGLIADQALEQAVASAYSAEQQANMLQNVAGNPAQQQLAAAQQLNTQKPRLSNKHVLPEDTGIATLDAGEVVSAAGGGLVAFAGGGGQFPLIDQALDLEEVYDPQYRAFIKAIHMQESGGKNSSRTSVAGAEGPMQVMPATFRAMNSDGTLQPGNALDNMRAGIRYAKQALQETGGDPKLSAMYYYGGPNAVGEYIARGRSVSGGKGFPNTVQYAEQVLARMNPIGTAYAAEAPNPWGNVTSGASTSSVGSDAQEAAAARVAGASLFARRGEKARNPAAPAYDSVPNDAQAARDREQLQEMLRSLGAAGMDVLSMPGRAVAGAAEFAITRPLRALGAPIPYLPDSFYGGDRASMTPYYDQLRRERAVTEQRKEADASRAEDAFLGATYGMGIGALAPKAAEPAAAAPDTAPAFVGPTISDDELIRRRYDAMADKYGLTKNAEEQRRLAEQQLAARNALYAETKGKLEGRRKRLDDDERMSDAAGILAGGAAAVQGRQAPVQALMNALSKGAGEVVRGREKIDVARNRLDELEIAAAEGNLKAVQELQRLGLSSQERIAQARMALGVEAENAITKRDIAKIAADKESNAAGLLKAAAADPKVRELFDQMYPPNKGKDVMEDYAKWLTANQTRIIGMDSVAIARLFLADQRALGSTRMVGPKVVDIPGAAPGPSYAR